MKRKSISEYMPLSYFGTNKRWNVVEAKRTSVSEYMPLSHFGTHKRWIHALRHVSGATLSSELNHEYVSSIYIH